jgi:hypothetical protein
VRLLDRRKEADAALSTLERRERSWRTNTRVMRAWFMQHRAGVIVGGGFGAGFATSLLPIAPLLRLVSALAGTMSLMLEGPFLRLLSAAHREAASAEPATTAQ